jgi:alpha-D-ribose 1-methylphosphonate 5-triphosphate synthase subunit PhnG
VFTREGRFEAIAVADAAELISLADRVLARHEVTVLRPPASGAVMMRAVETAEGSVFNLGEVAVTEAEVELGGERGYCMVLGHAPEKALAGAILDAAAQASVAATEIETLLAESVARREDADRQAWASLAATRVRFDEIPE